MGTLVWYGLSSLILGVVLFFPARKLILGLAVNRHQRKTRRTITGEELEVLTRKMTITAAALAFTFAFLYTRFLMARLFG